MSIRKFRRLSRRCRREIIEQITDPVARRVLEVAFLGPGKLAWEQVAGRFCGAYTANTVCQIAHRALESVTFPPTDGGSI